jgi:hypothetical protein
MRLLIAAIAACFLSACQVAHYSAVKEGKFYGKLNVRWIGEDNFIFYQNREQPFYFERHDGTKIVPNSIYTDGGSIPGFVRGLPGLSPWGVAPSFIIHDWLFEAHKRKLPGYEAYTLQDTAQIMSECTKTLMKSRPKKKTEGAGDVSEASVKKRKFAMYAMYVAVKSWVARGIWDKPPGTLPPEEEPSAEIKADVARNQVPARQLRNAIGGSKQWEQVAPESPPQPPAPSLRRR